MLGGNFLGAQFIMNVHLRRTGYNQTTVYFAIISLRNTLSGSRETYLFHTTDEIIRVSFLRAAFCLLLPRVHIFKTNLFPAI